jgi:polyisoprenyl-teichoic acid--peptidoglycan teichoic acid transferase
MFRNRKPRRSSINDSYPPPPSNSYGAPPPLSSLDYLDERNARWRQQPPDAFSRPRRRRGCLSLPLFFFLFAFLGLLGIYLFAPLRTNLLILGIDYSPNMDAVGRSDTIILATFVPFKPYVGMLSIPRDLWVAIPGYGENRINTAHFFAEAQQPGSGPLATIDTIHQDFGVSDHYFLRIRFEGFKDVVNAMGGVDIVLDQPMAGYPAGQHHLTGNKALAFARSRMGADDFYRMQQGQIVIKSAFRQLLNPLKWPRLPVVLLALSHSVDTNVPIWQWPRLGLALLRLGPAGIDSRTIMREMVTPFVNDQGADVLLPNWERINPVLMEMFGQ